MLVVNIIGWEIYRSGVTILLQDGPSYFVEIVSAIIERQYSSAFREGTVAYSGESVVEAQYGAAAALQGFHLAPECVGRNEEDWRPGMLVF
jgi:hypothetical protein